MNRYTKRSNKKQKRVRRKTNKKQKQKRMALYFGGAAKQRKTNSKKGSFVSMNCNPAIEKDAIKEGSCLTEPVLQKLKDSFNKEHPTHRIVSTDANEIWSDLKSKMPKCSKEDCWLNVIKDPDQRKKLDEELFSPDMPKEWKQDPNTWLSNFDIIAVLKQYEKSHTNFKVIGPTPIDFDTKPPEKGGKCVWEELCKFSLKRYLDEKKTKIGIVFNLDKHNQGGSHWISLFLDLDDNFIFFLDSTGEKMPKEVKNLIDRIVKQGGKKGDIDNITVYDNHPTEHQMGDTECGVYSLFFIITMLTNEAEGKKFGNFMEKINFFKDKKISDEYIEKYRKVYFNN